MLVYLDKETEARIEAVCNKHYENGHCIGCPLRAACEEGRRPGESSADFTCRWETGMAEALKSLERKESK